MAWGSARRHLNATEDNAPSSLLYEGAEVSIEHRGWSLFRPLGGASEP